MMLPSESVKKFYIEVVADFLIFPMMCAIPLLGLLNLSYTSISDLQLLTPVQKFLAMLFTFCK
jgi:hypothetical protein